MGKKKFEGKRVRIQMDLPPQTIERLKFLKEKTEATSYAEVTKHAYRLYDRIVSLSEVDAKFLVKKKDGTITELEIFY